MSFSRGISWPVGLPSLPNPTDEALRDALGTDFLFDNQFIINNGDYAEIAGEANLRQSILRRLMTRKGSYLYRPTYGVGLPYYVKQKLTLTTLAQIKQDIIANLSQDRRIASVDEIILTPQLAANGTQTLRVALSITPIAGNVTANPASERYSFVF